MAMAAREVGIARRLWNRFRNESIYVLYTPFIVCLASAVLDHRSFTHFLSQDIFIFKAFAHAYELAEECADDEDDKVSIRKLRKHVMKKINNRSDLVRDWGFELPNESTADIVTVKYTDFLLAAASGKVGGEKYFGKIATPFEKTKLAAYILAAVAPCMRFYASISKEILAFQVVNCSDHIYKKWIASLSSQNYEGAALEIEDLLEKLSVSLTGEELEVVEKIYHQALRHELQFFYAQPMFQKTVVLSPQPQDPGERSISIFCDFDMTCTAIDSSAILAEIAIRTARKADVEVTETQLVRMSSADLRNTWGFISSRYTEEYEQCIGSITSGDKGDLDYEGLCKALEKVAEFEKKANTRVIESGVLKGINREDIKRAGEHLILQEGCKGFFHEITKRENLKTDIHCLSYCWCGDMIRSAFSSGNMKIEDVYCNEFAYEDNICTGDMIRKVESPMEKLEAFKEKVEKQSDGGITVCIGGSVGDTLCLLNADIGIAIDPSRSLTRLGDKFGITFVPLFTGLVTKQLEMSEGSFSGWKARSGVIYTVSSWAEIHAFILGISR